MLLWHPSGPCSIPLISCSESPYTMGKSHCLLPTFPICDLIYVCMFIPSIIGWDRLRPSWDPNLKMLSWTRFQMLRSYALLSNYWYLHRNKILNFDTSWGIKSPTVSQCVYFKTNIIVELRERQQTLSFEFSVATMNGIVWFIKLVILDMKPDSFYIICKKCLLIKLLVIMGMLLLNWSCYQQQWLKTTKTK